MNRFVKPPKPPKTPFRVGNVEFQDPILLCVLLYLLLLRDYSGFLRLSLIASCLHECGHVLVYYCFCRKFPHIRVTATGFCMKMKGVTLSPFKLFCLALAGPAVNFLLAGLALLWLEHEFTLACAAFLSANILLGCFNLMPIPPLDGAVIVNFFIQNVAEKLHFRRG